jgi:hypothetical protein
MQLARRLQPRSKIVLRTCASRNDIIDGIMFAMEEMLQAKPRGKHARYVTPDVAFAEASGTSFVRYAEMLVKEAYASGRLATTGRTKSMRVMELQYAIMSFAGLGYKAADVGKNGCEHPGNNADSQLMSHGRTSRFRSATSTTEDTFPMLLR